jgi:hypothetical protein
MDDYHPVNGEKIVILYDLMGYNGGYHEDVVGI